MKRTLALVALLWICGLSTEAQNVLTRKEIYRANCDAVVDIDVGSARGNGFTVSDDGLILTANHVVATQESGFRQYAQVIKVTVSGRMLPLDGVPVSRVVSNEQVNYDYALIRIGATNLPHVSLGTWDDAEVGDAVMIITSWPGWGCMMLEGIVAGKGAAATQLGPRPVNTFLFQCPVRNGFSGAPVFDSRGKVIGIVTTKVFGISNVLDKLGKGWKGMADLGVGMRSGNVDLATTMFQLVDNLNENLISGLGSAVSINYAKEQEKQRNPPTQL